MILTGVILAGIVVYVIWAIRKIQKNRKNGQILNDMTGTDQNTQLRKFSKKVPYFFRYKC